MRRERPTASVPDSGRDESRRMCFLLGNPQSCWVDDVITPTTHLCGGVSTCPETNTYTPHPCIIRSNPRYTDTPLKSDNYSPLVFHYGMNPLSITVLTVHSGQVLLWRWVNGFVVFMAPLGSEEPRPEMGPELDQVQILLSVIWSVQVEFSCCVSVCAIHVWVQGDASVHGIRCVQCRG